ncbi:hypothetical protein [Mesorhizobium sp.]|uniref:hypothetical protein n=1 Tax=Mesorhizobium sp. TaxID=1871066 RepID=UPI000FE35043|nr:hypothetical protein [Mesorhizobium sp.]RWB95593.1 MAG: hypothetical protein EOQ56_27995 [Mesorhizobium sp.]RWI35527.1 MAG: hypothetical protein EOR14_28920 [Mesorhizobium sp.]RWJ03463.1 MAG: hypothetical protein EOR24_32300 [Mesorhizobium sp.]RWJ66304.1 MAG: hypothetical protein EOR34_28215 [Mesorhizobium sp.]
MTKIMLLTFLLNPGGAYELGDTGNGYPMREYESLEECQANVRQQGFLPNRFGTYFVCREVEELHA